MTNPGSLITRSSICGLAMIVFLISPVVASAEEASSSDVFSRYARYGADIWADNPSAKISGEGTACISCHTSMPYALVEPLLPGKYPAYTDLINNVSNRALTWSDNTPWYSDQKLQDTAIMEGLPPDTLLKVLDAADSRGVEAVFNTLIMAFRDAYAHEPAQADTVQAFENMWSEQKKSGPAAGRWGWIYANLIPWEVTDSDLWGASLACVAASVYPDLAPADNLQLLHTTLQQAAVNEDVSLHVKSAVLWCDTETGGQVLDNGVATNIAVDLLELQHENGGWALRDLGPWVDWEGSDADCCAQREIRPDAYATGFVTLALARSRHLIPQEKRAGLDEAVVWIERELGNPYPAEPRHNKHNSGEKGLPQFRNNIYTNAGHMWAFLAKAVHKNESAPWRAD